MMQSTHVQQDWDSLKLSSFSLYLLQSASLFHHDCLENEQTADNAAQSRASSLSLLDGLNGIIIIG